MHNQPQEPCWLPVLSLAQAIPLMQLTAKATAGKIGATGGAFSNSAKKVTAKFDIKKNTQETHDVSQDEKVSCQLEKCPGATQ